MLGVLFIFGFVNAIMYTFPYVRYVFYEQQIIAMGINNTQSGQLMSIYSLCMMASMIPGGILADKFSTKKCLVYSVLASFVAICIYAFTMTFTVACFVWFMVGLSTNFVFWCGITKAVGMVGDPETQGSCYGIYYASSGIISAILNAICLWASGFSEDPTTSFMIAMWVMAGGTLIAALLVVVFFKEKEVEAASEDDTFQFKYVGAVLKNPMTWLIAIMVMCAYGLYTSVSYFSPYLTDVLGIPLVNSTLLNIVRSNLMIMPDTVSPGFATFVSLLPSMVAMMLYGVIWSGLRECKFKAAYFGTVIGIGSILGYTPDFFYFTIFGKWMDTYGNAAYKMIFGFLMATAVLGMILAIVMRVLISRNKVKVEE